MKKTDSKPMEKNKKILRVFYIIGIVALVIGIIDPLEGSIVIAAGSILTALATYLQRDKYWKIFLLSLILIVIGVLAMFYLSSLGGFGGTSSLSWWWGVFILPYPIGWLMTIVILVIKFIKKM